MQALLVCLPSHGSGARKSINCKVMWALIQWHRFLLSVQELSVVWERDGVQWVTEWKMWRMAQRDSVGEEPGETVESEGKAGVSSRWDERVEEELTLLALCSGKGVVGAFTYGQPSPPVLLPLLPAPGTAFVITKPPCSVSVATKPESDAFCSSCSNITCGNTSGARQCQFPRRVFLSPFPVWPQRYWCERNTHINNLSDRFR